jgi:CRP-like cAMP-binding protein
MVTAAWLKKTELFGALEEFQLDVLLSHSSVDSFPGGTTIFRQGDEATHLFVLIEGEIDLAVKTEEKIAFMTSRIDKEGSAFGIPSLIEPFRYNVTATSLKASKVLTLDARSLRDHLEKDPRMGMEIMKKLASIYFERLNKMRSGVSNLLKMFKAKTP